MAANITSVGQCAAVATVPHASATGASIAPVPGRFPILALQPLASRALARASIGRISDRGPSIGQALIEPALKQVFPGILDRV
jgi:hypothetical protein